ncbi:MAG TPA: class I tRNA ligase family protein, partial [Pseudonocardia sp.]|nr:class I tRNA ligase family protein [Pseudonocardia sp.]
MIISGIPRTLDDLASPGFVRSAPPEWAAGVATPFSARRVTLGPGEVTAAHNHHDTEVWTVLDGIGEVRSDDRVVPLSAGDSVRLPPLGVHTLRNLADDRPLTFLTQWWEDMDALADAHTRRVAAPPPADRPLVLLPSFPTPNGELHLGHLAGPYLNADACARWAAARGERAHVLLGTVGHQSQVAAAAQARGLEFHELAERNTDGIIEGLAAAGIGWDVFVRPRETAYPAMAADVFATLERRGALVRRTEPTAFCAPCDRFLFEAFVAGRCPHCGSSQTAGIECEACALPFRDSELVGHACARCGTPAGMRELTRWFFPLEAARDRLAGHLARASMSSRLRCYVDRVLAAPLPDLPVSVVAEDGIPLRVEQERPGSPYAQQRMYSAFELAARYLTALDALARTKGCSGWAEYARAHRPRTALFFGFDNAYLRAFVFPAVLGAYTADVPLPEHLVCNEFYTLDGAKFS